MSSTSRMRGCVSSRQRFQSNCLANADAALRGKRVAFSFARSLSLSHSLSFSVFPIYSLSRSFNGLVRLAHAPGATDSSGLGGHRAHAPVPTPSERLSLPLSLLAALSPSLSSSRAEYIHIRTVHFSLYPVSFLGPHSLTFGLLRFRRLDRARVRRIVASFSHAHRTRETRDEVIAARASRQARLST